MTTVRRISALAGAALLLVAIVTPAVAGSIETVRDEFSEISFDGNDGSVDWSGSWIELPFGDGPATGQIQVVGGNSCVDSKCLRLGDEVLPVGVARQADLTGHVSANLTFQYQREMTGDDGGDGKIRVRVGPSIWSWTTVATFPVSRDDSAPKSASIDLSEWAGAPLYVGFFGEGQLDGFFYVDNVEILMSSNRPPVFDEVPSNQSDTEGDWINVVPQVTDPDGDDLSFAATGLPPGVSIDPDSGIISGTVGYAAAQLSPFATVVTVSDEVGGRAEASFSWSVADRNRGPTLAPIDDVVASESALLHVTTDGSDPDLPHDDLSYSLPEAPVGASINSVGRISWNPGEGHGPGSYPFTVEVTDSGSPALSARRSFEVAVTEVNKPPLLSSLPDQTSRVGDTVSLAVGASDPDIPPNDLTFVATGLPGGVVINSSSGLITGTITDDAAASSNTVTLTVRDNGNPAKQAVRTFAWQVTTGNRAPVLAPIADQQPADDGVVRFTAAATDADVGDTFAFWLADGIDPVPAEAAIDAATGEFTWQPTDEEHGAIYRFNVGVSDSGTPRLSDTQLVTVTIPELNQPPVVSDPGDQESTEGDAISLEIEAVDSDTIRFSATGLPVGLTINPVTGAISGTVDFEAAAGSPYSVAVTARDGGVPPKSATTSFEWTIINKNRPPVVVPLDLVAIVGEPTPVYLDATDPDGDELTVEVMTQPRSGVLSGDAPDFVYSTPGGEAQDSITFLVSDGELETEAEVRILIRTGNSAPTADADTYDLGQDETLVVAAPGVLTNDSDLDNDSLVVSLVSPPDHGVLVLAPDGSFTYAPDSGYAGGDKFVYAATDVLGEQSTATVVLNIAAAPGEALPIVDDEPRLDVIVATTPRWEPPPDADATFTAMLPRAIVAALHAGISNLPAMRYPLLLLAIALLLGLTVGRVSVLPLGAARKQQEGRVEAYDATYGTGRIVFGDGDEDVFVQERALVKAEKLEVGQRVRLVSAVIRGRRIALKVWPA